MAMKVSITIDSPFEFKRIANGERVMEQTAMDDYDVQVVESDDEESPLTALNDLLDEFGKNVRQSKRQPKISPISSFKNGGSKIVNDELPR